MITTINAEPAEFAEKGPRVFELSRMVSACSAVSALIVVVRGTDSAWGQVSATNAMFGMVYPSSSSASHEITTTMITTINAEPAEFAEKGPRVIELSRIVSACSAVSALIVVVRGTDSTRTHHSIDLQAA
jgi:hypothetical protein